MSRPFLLSVSALVILSGCVTLRVPADNWFHPGAADLPADLRATPDLPAGYALQDIYFVGDDGTRLHSLFVSSPSASGTVLYFGGDTFRIGTSGLSVAKFFPSLNMNVLLIDYRGYGLSEGVPTLESVKSDAVHAFDLARSPARPAQPIALHGFSMGSFVACAVTESRTVAALILESSATSASDWANHLIPWYAKPFVRVSIAEDLRGESNETRLQRYNGYLLLLVGSADHVTPSSMSHRLFSVAASSAQRKRFYIAPRAGHGTVLLSPSAAREYSKFLSLVQPAPVSRRTPNPSLQRTRYARR